MYINYILYVIHIGNKGGPKQSTKQQPQLFVQQ